MVNLMFSISRGHAWQARASDRPKSGGSFEKVKMNLLFEMVI